MATAMEDSKYLLSHYQAINPVAVTVETSNSIEKLTEHAQWQRRNKDCPLSWLITNAFVL